jgi:subtilase family protein
MRASRLLVALLVVAALAPAAYARKGYDKVVVLRPPPTRPGVVALIDTGINPYSTAFRDGSRLAYKPPWTYMPGYPKNTPALRLSLGLPYEKAVKKDADVWAQVKPNTLYWIPGTRIVGAISMGAGGVSCPTVGTPPANGYTNSGCEEHRILDDHGHGTMTASRAAGSPNSLAPRGRIVEIEGLGAKSVEWAADQGWIDVQSNSWVSFVPPPVPNGTIDAFRDASKKMLVLAASGNGAAFSQGVAPTPTQLLSTAPAGVVIVGGHDNGKMTLWSGAPPHVVADAYAGMSAIHDSVEPMRPDPIACCTSAASPYAAGGALAIVLQARKILGDHTTGIHGGVVAMGRAGLVPSGPLADGKFTLEELKDVFLHTAEAHPAEGRDDGDIHWAGDPRPPDHAELGPGANPFCIGCTTVPVEWKAIPDDVSAYTLIGYGGINETSVSLAGKVLLGRADLPARPNEDQLYQLDQQLRESYYP